MFYKSCGLDVIKPIIKDKAANQINFFAVERKVVLSLLRLTYSSQKQIYDRLRLKKIEKNLTAINSPMKALDMLTLCSLQNLWNFQSTMLCHRTPKYQ